MRTDRRTEMTMIIVAFRNYANAPKNCKQRFGADFHEIWYRSFYNKLEFRESRLESHTLLLGAHEFLPMFSAFRTNFGEVRQDSFVNTGEAMLHLRAYLK